MKVVQKVLASQVPGVLAILEGRGLHPHLREETVLPQPWQSSGLNLFEILVPCQEEAVALQALREETEPNSERER